MNRQVYENRKMQITKKVSGAMDDYVSCAFSGLDNRLLEFIKRLYEGRRNRALNGGRWRDATISIALGICGVNELNSDHLKVIAAGEFYNMASYYQNWHLDDKKEVKTEQDKKLCHIASHFFRELAEGIILDTGFQDSIKLKILKEISESNKAIQAGQSLELNVSNIDSLRYLNAQEIKETYLRRCYLFSGRFYGCSLAMAPIMAGRDKKTVDLFRNIGCLIGTGMQIVNDVGDFCLNLKIANCPEKDYQDQFADLEKGTLTLPVYELSKHICINDYAERKLSIHEKEGLLKTMIAYRCFDSSRIETNKIRNEIRRKMSQLKKTDFRDELKMASGIFFGSNKFYANLRKRHGYVWGGKYG